jgi:hypothetical protein
MAYVQCPQGGPIIRVLLGEIGAARSALLPGKERTSANHDE